MPDRKTIRVRRVLDRSAADSPRPPSSGETIAVDAGTLAQLAKDVGVIAGQNQQITQRLTGVENGLHEVRRDVTTLRTENAAQHAETAQQISALGGDLSEMKGRLNALEENKPAPKPPGGSSEGRKDKESAVKVWGDIFNFVKTWWPGLVALAAAIYAWFEKKGVQLPK